MNLLFWLTVTLSIGLLSANSAFSQSGTNPIPASPTAMTFQKYVDYPVDYSTGVPQISVPLYTISLKDYSFPITASFHASGRRTEMDFSVLGMNWALNATGVINREIRGRPDESANDGHVENSISSYYPQKDHCYDLMSIDANTHLHTSDINAKDAQYDIYSLYVNGISTKFIIKDNGTFVFLTYCPYTLSGGWNGFTLTDNKGIVYQFGGDVSSYGITETPFSSPYITKPTSWYLSSISTPSGSHIYFTYKRSSKSFSGSGWIGDWKYKDIVQFHDCENWNSNSCFDAGGCNTKSTFDGYCPPSTRYQTPYYNEETDFGQIYVDNIVFDNGKIIFTVNDTPSSCLLTSCSVSNTQGTTIENVNFSYYSKLPASTDVLPNNNSLTIHNITFQDSKNINTEQYGFDYYNAPSFSNVRDFAESKDYWGYANSWSQTTSPNNYIPLSSVHVDFMDYNGSSSPVPDSYAFNINGNPNCKAPSLMAKTAGMIKTIYYPTGGKSDYVYEANKITDDQGHILDGPGIRIKQITSDDGYGHVGGKTYEYGDDGTGKTLAIPSKDYDYFTENIIMLFINGGHAIVTGTNGGYQHDFLGSYKYREYSSDAVPEVEAASHFPTYYQKVTEYDYSANNVKNGKTIYTYTYPTTYHSSTYAPTSCTNDYFIPQIYSAAEWTMPQLSSKTVQKWDAASASYKPVTSTAIAYIDLNSVNIPEVSLYKSLQFPTDDGSSGVAAGLLQKTMMGDPYYLTVYVLLDRPISCGIRKPSSETSIAYDDAGNQLNTVTNYFYDNLVHVNPTRVSTTTSDGITKTQYITYPGDYAGSATNKSSLPMEQVMVETKSGAQKVISGQINTYGNYVVYQSYKWQSDKPVDIAGFKFSNRAAGVIPPAGSAAAFGADGKYVSKITYAYDSKNNPINIVPDKNMPVSYLWGYNQTYPEAEVKNAPAKDVFFTSFEDGDGNSTAGDGKTGQYSHTGTYTKSLTGVDAGSYILSYWTKSGSAWSLTSSGITVPAGGSYSISLNAQIDELRFYPANAFMKSYTYQPLVGMTTLDDEKNMMTFYEYDDYGRLKIIRDKDYNIVKKICYNEQGMASNCEVYGNQFQSSYFTRNNCSCGSQGGGYSVVVQPNTYFSTSLAVANQQAQDYIAANGQNIANIDGNGSCTTSNSQTGSYSCNVNDNVTAVFTNLCNSNKTYTATLIHGSTSLKWYDINSTAFTSLPAGKYNVDIHPTNTSVAASHTYILNGYSNGPTTDALFQNVIFSSSVTIIVN